MRRRHLLAAAATLAAPAVQGQDLAWPNRPVKFINPFPPGGPGDTYARLLAEHCSRTLGQPFVVENRPGATGAVGTVAVMRSPPDGHTLLFSSNSGFSMAPLVVKQPAYDAQRDFAPVSMVVRYPYYLVANPRFASVAALVAEAKANPGKLNFSTIGIGSGGHLVAEMFRLRAGIEVVHVPYVGAAASLMGVATGQVDYYFDSIGNAQGMVNEGRLNGLAVTGTERAAAAPQVPTMQECGFADFDVDLWLGLLAPLGVPPDILARLNAECDAFLAQPAIQARMRATAFNPAGGPAALLARRIAQETTHWREIVRQAGLLQG
jgi:tripartite-type tricarboxylate transporter receptor subunit TctC